MEEVNESLKQSLFSHLFAEQLIFLDYPCKNKEDFFEKIAKFLADNDYVTDGFLSAIKEREENFPTGLRTEPFHVAIPHTDPKHILTPFIAVIKPTSAVPFWEMGIEDKEVNAELIFLLGIHKAENQIPLLQTLMEMFMEETVMKKLITSQNRKETYTILQNQIVKGVK